MTTGLSEHVVGIVMAVDELNRRINAAVAAAQEASCPAGVDPAGWDTAALQVVDQLLVGGYNLTTWLAPTMLRPLTALAATAGETPLPAGPLAVRAEQLRHAARALDRQLTGVMLDVGDAAGPAGRRALRPHLQRIDELMEALAPNDLWCRADAAADAIADLAAKLDTTTTEEARQ